MAIVRIGALIGLISLAGCAGEPDTAAPEADTDTDTDADTDTDSDADADADTDTDTDTDTPKTGDDWRQHPDIGSLVYVQWSQEEAGETLVEYNFDGEWVAIPTVQATAGLNEALIVGVPYGSEAAWRRTLPDKTVVDGTPFQTAALDKEFVLPEVLISDAAQWTDSGNYFLSSINQTNTGWTGGEYWVFIIDRQGRVVWAVPTPDRNWTLAAQVAVTGDHILWDEQTYWADLSSQGVDSTVHRTYLDAEIDEVATPGLQHYFVQLPDQTLAWASQYHADHEALVERHPDSEDINVVWSCEDDWPNSGACKSNGHYYNPKTDTHLLSFYTNNSVVEVDRVTGESLWWAGVVEDGFDFIPESSQFNWQHGVSFTDEGHLLVSSKNETRDSTVLWEYAVDRKLGTLTEVWVHDAEVLASYNGDAWKLDSGNYLHTLGSAGEIKEYTADGDEVWHVTFNDRKLLGRGEFIEDLYTLVSP